jgi:hypothetical protein
VQVHLQQEGLRRLEAGAEQADVEARHPVVRLRPAGEVNRS